MNPLFHTAPRLATALLGLLLCLSLNIAKCADLTEEQIKVSYLYNFITLTEWPADTGDEINLCAMQADPFSQYIDELDDEVAGNRTISLHKLSQLDEPNCHVFFISQASDQSATPAARRARDASLLAITDAPDALDNEFIIGLENKDNRVVFSIDNRAAQQHGLVLSSKLLRMALRVAQ